MNCLKRSVANKREKRKKEEEKLQSEPKIDIVAELVGLSVAIGAVILMCIALKNMIN